MRFPKSAVGERPYRRKNVGSAIVSWVTEIVNAELALDQVRYLSKVHALVANSNICGPRRLGGNVEPAQTQNKQRSAFPAIQLAGLPYFLKVAVGVDSP